MWGYARDLFAAPGGQREHVVPALTRRQHDPQVRDASTNPYRPTFGMPERPRWDAVNVPNTRPTPPRVLIRSPTPADRAEFLAAMHASRNLHRPWLPPTTPQSFDRMLRRVDDERSEPLLVCRWDDGAIVGYFNMGEIVRGTFRSAYLGYGAVAVHVGRGYMSEGMQLVLGHAFTTLRLHRLEANIQPANEASIALARRSGFVREGFSERYLKIGGRWRDHERWAIRAEQWRAQRRRPER
jgi:[ribosomal protein S5]-alanine N-acetyltransferase